MVLPRSSTLRASSIARFARPIRRASVAELQPWQRVLQRTTRRTYASAHGTPKQSDLPWAVGAVGATGVGLWFVTSQDLSHAEHEEHHDVHDKPQSQNVAEIKEPSSPAKEEEKKEEEETAAQGGDVEGLKESRQKEDHPDPSETDPASSGKPPKSVNEQSGKQQGLDNEDTKYKASDVANDPEKSRKSEGAVETAKLKGTVAADRPAADNKSEKGKTKTDKDA